LGAAPMAAVRARETPEPRAPAASAQSASAFWSRLHWRVELLHAPPPKPVADQAAARRLLAMTNRERIARHLRPLTWWTVAVGPAARAQTDRMVRSHRLYHTPNLRTLLYRLDVEAIGENVGVGPSIDNVEVAFMRSREHR